MREVDALAATSKLGELLDQVQAGEEVAITRGGKVVAKLVPAVPAFDREQARAAAQRIREMRKGVTLGGISIRELIDEGPAVSLVVDDLACITDAGKIDMEDGEIRAALGRHWAASDANDFDAEHQIYREDAVLEYPQSGERIRGRHNIQASRFAQPNKKRFTVRRILGAADLWVTEFVLTYDGQPSYTVSIMEFSEGKVVRETQYFADAFEPGPSRAQWVERMAP